MIKFSLEKYTEKDYNLISEMAERFFLTKNHPEQMQCKDVTWKFVSKHFPNSLNAIKDNKTVVGFTFTLPCDKKSMMEFVNKKITERDLFYKIRDEIKPKDYETLYLVDSIILPTYRRKGLATRAFIRHIKEYQKSIKNIELFCWPVTEEGRMLARKIAKITGLKLRERVH